MIINFSKAIEGEFYEIDETLGLDDALLSGRVGKFISDAKIKGWYVLNEGILTVKCKLTVKAEFECDRCLAPTVLNIKTEVAETFFKEPVDEETLLYSDEKIDLRPYIDERVILAVPTRILCKADCKGLCPKCGTNLNEGSCNCSAETDTDIPQENNQFAVLLDMNISSGGKKNGSSKV